MMAMLTWQFPTPDEAMVRGGGMLGHVDVATGSGILHVSRRFANGARFHLEVIEGTPQILIIRRDRHPVHAAALRRGDVALLLHGPSGVGKSTLAYLAYRAGIDVLSDDSTKVQLEPELRVWGDGSPARVQLLEQARRDFPELAQGEPRTSTGDVAPPKIPVDTRREGRPFRPYVRQARVCLLSRDARPIDRSAVAPDEIRRALLDAPEAVLDLNPGARAQVAAALAGDGGWRLKLSDDVNAALPHLLAMFDEAPVIPI